MDRWASTHMVSSDSQDQARRAIPLHSLHEGAVQYLGLRWKTRGTTTSLCMHKQTQKTKKKTIGIFSITHDPCTSWEKNIPCATNSILACSDMRIHSWNCMIENHIANAAETLLLLPQASSTKMVSTVSEPASNILSVPERGENAS